MLNTIREYIVTQQSQYQMYATPFYMSGRKEDIKVQVDGKSISSAHYEINGTNLNFKADHQPKMGARVRIYRETSKDTRLVEFSDGSLLKADTLDLSAQQLFNLAQEAFDQATYTQIGGEQFYHTSDQPPVGVKQGALWYDISPSVNELKVWNGEEWYAVAPLVENYALTLSDRAFFHSVPASPITIDAHVFNVPNLANSTTVFLNGVRLTGWETTEDAGDDPLAAFNDGDVDWVAADIADNGYKSLYLAGTITAGDVITVTTVQGGYASTVKHSEEQAKTYRDEAKYWAEQADQVESNVIVGVDALSQFAVNPKDESFIYDGETFYSALHYADIATSAAATATAALTYAADANLYANNPEDTPYTDSSGQTGYSALHYKNKAEDAATSAGTSAGAATDTLNDVNQLKLDTNGLKIATEYAQGQAEQASIRALSDKVLAESAKDLAQKHANSDVEFLDGSTPYKSAKMHTQEAVQAASDIGNSIAAAEVLEESLKSQINDPANIPIEIDGETPFYSARHYAVLAETAANQTVDNLVGWDLIDANTISTNTTGAPVIHSGTTLDLKATNAVRANDVPLPFMGGSLSFDTSNHKGFKNQTVTKVANTWGILFDTPFDYASEYSVMATYAGSGNNIVRVIKSTDKVELSVYDSLGNSIDTGEIAVTLYKFT
jgi:hypothetical protein